jgi:hypothetical protein
MSEWHRSDTGGGICAKGSEHSQSPTIIENLRAIRDDRPCCFATPTPHRAACACYGVQLCDRHQAARPLSADHHQHERGQNFSPPAIVLDCTGWEMPEIGQPATVVLWRLADDSSTAEFEALADSQFAR